MTSLETSYLIMVLVVFVGFAGALAYFSQSYAAHARSLEQNRQH